MARRKKRTARQAVRDGLEKLAFGDVSDAVRLVLAYGEGDESRMEGLDLFNIAEIKKTKDGFEIKLFDRQKALEALDKLGESETAGANLGKLYDAIAKSAAAEEGGADNGC